MSKSRKAVIDYASPGMKTPSRWGSRGAMLLISALLLFGIIFAYAGSNWAVVLYKLLTDGALAIAWAFAMAGIGCWLLTPSPLAGEGRGEGEARQTDGDDSRNARSPIREETRARDTTITPHPSPLPQGERGQSDACLRFATSFAVGSGVTSLIVLGLGLIGLLNHKTAVGILGVGLILAAMRAWPAVQKSSRESVRSWMSEPARWDWCWVAVVPFLAVVIVQTMLPAGVLWDDEPNGYDVLEYHLQVPREWYEAGKIIPLHHNVFSYFPFGVETHYLLAMQLLGGPWSGMHLAQMMHVGFIVFTVIAIYGVALSIANQRAATLAAVLAATVPWMPLLAPVAYNEGGLLLYGTLAIGWAMIGRNWKDFALAGAMAGFACGVKYTAVPMVLLAVPVAMVIARFFAPSPLAGEGGGEGGSRQSDGAESRNARASISEETRARDTAVTPHPNPLPQGERGQGIAFAAVFVIAGLLVFSPWLIRNFAWTGNPIFPEGMRIFGRAHFSEVQVERWERAHSPREDQRSIKARGVAVWDQILADWKFGFVIVPLGVVAMAINRKRPAIVLPAILFVTLTAFWIFFTHLQGRFFVLAIPLCAWACAGIDRPAWRMMLIVLLGISSGIYLTRSTSAMSDLLLKWNAHLGFESSLFETDKPVAFVGGGVPFTYNAPRIWYRTVFDVDTSDGSPIEDAWLKGFELMPGTQMMIANSELERFSRTYWKIPRPSDTVDQIVIRYSPSPPAPASKPSP